MLKRCVWLTMLVLFFFKQKTADEMRISDWSSDVCSSDLRAGVERQAVEARAMFAGEAFEMRQRIILVEGLDIGFERVGGVEDARAEIGRASCRVRVCQYV